MTWLLSLKWYTLNLYTTFLFTMHRFGVIFDLYFIVEYIGVYMWNKIGICDKCGKESSLVPSFGKHICSSCRIDRPKKGTGNSGLRDIPEHQQMISHDKNSFFFDESDELTLQLVPKSNKIFGNLFFSHYPESKGIPGRSLCYLIYNGLKFIGIIGASSPPYNYKKFRDFFNITNDTQFVNNNVFRLIEHEKNIGTKVLKLFRSTIELDYQRKYNEKLLGIVTFVEPPRTGAIYKADNWKYLGLTQGKRMRRDSDTWEKVFVDSNAKHIYAYLYNQKRHS